MALAEQVLKEAKVVGAPGAMPGKSSADDLISSTPKKDTEYFWKS